MTLLLLCTLGTAPPCQWNPPAPSSPPWKVCTDSLAIVVERLPVAQHCISCYCKPTLTLTDSFTFTLTLTDSFTFTFAGTRQRRVWEDVAGCQPLDQKYDVALLEDFHGWLAANTVCLPDSKYPGQVASTVSKYLFFSRRGAPFDRGAWQAVLDVAKVDEWLERHAAQRRSPSTLYNYVCCIVKASLFCYGRLDLQPPAGYHSYLGAKGRVLRRRRGAGETHRLGQEGGLGPRDLRPMCQAVLGSSQCDLRMLQAVRAARGYLAGELASVSQSDFLFSLRYAMMHAMVTSAARPSALYTLSTKAMEHPLGRWEDGAPVLLRNPHHKTGAYVGPCRLVLSGHGKKALYLYYYTVRKAALLCWGLDSTRVFCNTRRKGLNASTVTAHLAALQLYCGVDEPLRSTDIRKAVASQLRGTKPGDDVAAGTVASALCHSVPTSDRYYVLG